MKLIQLCQFRVLVYGNGRPTVKKRRIVPRTFLN
jgi:hypothetical protein